MDENLHAPPVRVVRSHGVGRAGGADGGRDGVRVRPGGRSCPGRALAHRLDDRRLFAARCVAAICVPDSQTPARFRFKGEPPLKRVAPSLIISGRSLPPATEHFEDLGESAT